jgi:hypothetical protein
MFLAGCTRLGILRLVAALARYLAMPRKSHCRGARHQLRHLRRTTILGLGYHGPRLQGEDGSAAGELPVESCADANYAGYKDTYRSTTGQLLRVNGTAVLRASMLQPTVAQSIAEAECMAAAAASRRHCGTVNCVTICSCAPRAHTAVGLQPGGSCAGERSSAARTHQAHWCTFPCCT